MLITQYSNLNQNLRYSGYLLQAVFDHRCIQITSLEVMNRYTSSGTYIVRPLNYYVGPLAVSNNRAKTTKKVNKTMNRVLGWSP
jgi:hypothetical protein